jgi:DNA invertase Pin-like site-specific DNA recombinase
MTVIGYAGVSSLDQHLDKRLAALKAAGATKVYSEKRKWNENRSQGACQGHRCPEPR